MPRSASGGRHELGQNFLHHRPTLHRITSLVSDTSGAILELGAGDGALTARLARLNRPVTAIDIDEHRVARLRTSLPGVRVHHADVLTHPLADPVIVGNLPFHLTTPIFRRLLGRRSWRTAILLTQWEVARKRAGVGGGTMMTAQSAPWFAFDLAGRVPSWGFAPQPSVDGGVLRISRRDEPLVPDSDRTAYTSFVSNVFTGRGGSLTALISRAARVDRNRTKRALRDAGVHGDGRPRDLRPEHWAALWRGLR